MVFAALIGAEVKRKEDAHLLHGKGSFVGNLMLAGMQHVAFVRSPYPHARIGAIDASAALAIEDVSAVVTGAELAQHWQPLMPIRPDLVDPRHSELALPAGRVRYIGEPVAAVIGASPEIAEDGALAVVVDWQPLPAVVTPEAALAEDAPRLFDDSENNIALVWNAKAGDVESAFANAFRVVRQRMTNQKLAGAPIEARAVAAAPDPVSGGLTLWTSTQTPHMVRSHLAYALRIPESMLRVVAPDVGGGFGVKTGSYPEEATLALLARLYQTPFRWVESRSESLLATTQGRSKIADVEAAVHEDGTVSALRIRMLADVGAYPKAGHLPNLTGQMAVGVYRIPAVEVDVQSVYTNTVAVAPYRGAGRPEATYFIERIMNLIADELDIDPVEIRRKNFIPADAFPYKTPTGIVYDSGDYERALDKLLQIGRYDELRAEQAQRRGTDGDRLMGIGVAAYVEMSGMGAYESATVRVEPSGAVTVYTGTAPHGQGTATAFAQIVADQIGADFDQIVVKHGDTASQAAGGGTFASRGLSVGGAALVKATKVVRQKAQQVAAIMLEAAPDDIEYHEGRYQVKGVPDKALSLAQISRRAYSPMLPPAISSGLEATEFHRTPGLIYPFGAHLAVVEVERDTGIVHLRAFFAVEDCGPQINPMIVEGQVHGGLAQGISQALLEAVVYDNNGQVISGTFMDYGLPRADDFPPFVTASTVTPTPHNPLGAKGVGESATMGSTPAVVNAVLDALKPFGVRHLDMPLWPSKIWQAIQAAGGA